MFSPEEREALLKLLDARITARSADVRHLSASHGQFSLNEKRARKELRHLRSIRAKVEASHGCDK